MAQFSSSVEAGGEGPTSQAPNVSEPQATVSGAAAEPLSWDISPEDFALLRKVVDRLAAAKPKNFDKAGVTMDLNAAHANGCPLDFQKLLDFPDFDFFHDVYGIARHIDRETGRIGDCFLPRCARRDGTVTDALVSEVPDHD